ncbi:MAG: ATP-binding protein [Thermodesulfobacteriota bacterium]|nr:ATP-binding protein [Thermodesulfobacteriota bacterium]
MWRRINLRNRIYLILAALVIITLLGGLITVWYTYRLERVLTAIIDRNLVAYQSAESFETSLINQKGFVSYYFLDGDPNWLRQLGKYRQIFNEQLHTARLLVEDQEQKEAIDQIEREYRLYIHDKDRVIAHYKAGEREKGARLHRKVRDRFFNILELCEGYKDFHTKRIMLARNESLLQARKLRFIAGAAILVVFSLSVLLAFILANQILDPLRRLAQEANKEGALKKSGDEVKAISRSVHDLIEAAGQTHIELERSREHLLQAEKMAMVGKLAAGMAHSIRNPLTSVKMRLFSLSRSLKLTDYQKEDFDVISEEIRHTDAIVQSFLEFARPPRLKMQQISPSIVIDMGLQLLEHRLKSYDVTVDVNRERLLPEIQADPEQLKEVLVNLMINACEAMAQGGSIVLQEEEALAPSLGRVAVIRLKDNGPGIPESIRDRIFQPFFSTKEEGTGLGLSIATRIVEEHQGRLDVQSKEGQGSTFIITLPIKE